LPRKPDNPATRGPADRMRINLHEEYDVRYWTAVLGVTVNQLQAAVDEVGPMVADVRRHLDTS
jgi:hypothetical protein